MVDSNEQVGSPQSCVKLGALTAFSPQCREMEHLRFVSFCSEFPYSERSVRIYVQMLLQHYCYLILICLEITLLQEHTGVVEA